MASDNRIRQMQRSDVETVYKMGAQVREFAAGESPGFWPKETIYRWVDSPDDVLLVSERDGRITGYLMSQYHKPTGKATIENVYAQHKRAGIGTKLVSECLRQLKEKGVKSVCGMVQVENDPSIELFKSLGFERGHDFAWMKLSL